MKMTQLNQPEPKQRNIMSERLLGLSLFIPTATVIGIALFLEPDTRGFGTHQQLGLGACTFMELTTFPCPLCGMTTTFTHMAHFNFLEALTTQPFGIVLFTITFVLCIVSLFETLLPKDRYSRFMKAFSRREGLWFSMLLFGMVIGWIYKIIDVGFVDQL